MGGRGYVARKHAEREPLRVILTEIEKRNDRNRNDYNAEPYDKYNPIVTHYGNYEIRERDGVYRIYRGDKYLRKTATFEDARKYVSKLLGR